MNQRRKLLFALVAAPAALAHAQPQGRAGKPARVGILSASDVQRAQTANRVFIDAMRELGWIDGRNVIYDLVYAHGDHARLPVLAAELISRKPDVVKVGDVFEARAVFSAAPEIPLIFTGVNDPVASGLVRSFVRPGGNVTGIANIGPELGPRRLQLTTQAMPKIRRVGLLVTPRIAPRQTERKLIEESASRDLKLIPAVANEAGELEAAFRLLADSRAEAVLTTHIALYARERKRIISLAAKHRLPVIGHRSEFAEDGALMSYSSLLSEQHRRSAHLVDKVLKGAKAADIPVEQPIKFELVVNLKTAKTLGISIPETIMLQADRVIR